MSLIPFLYSDPFDSFRPTRLFNQQFGLHLQPEDLLTPSVLSSISPSARRCPFLYYRPWSSTASQLDAGSTVKFDKGNFEVSLDVAQFTPEEITVKIAGDDTIIVEGKHEEKEDEHGFISRQFVRRYVLPKGVDVNKVASELSSDGVLRIAAPKSESAGGDEHRVIEVKQTGSPAKPVEAKKEEKTEEKPKEVKEETEQ